jgi:hypothetical protein
MSRGLQMRQATANGEADNGAPRDSGIDGVSSR